MNTTTGFKKYIFIILLSTNVAHADLFAIVNVFQNVIRMLADSEDEQNDEYEDSQFILRSQENKTEPKTEKEIAQEYLSTHKIEYQGINIYEK